MSLIYNITAAVCVQMKASFRQLTASTCCTFHFLKRFHNFQRCANIIHTMNTPHSIATTLLSDEVYSRLTHWCCCHWRLSKNGGMVAFNGMACTPSVTKVGQLLFLKLHEDVTYTATTLGAPPFHASTLP